MTRKVACFTLNENTIKKMHGKGYVLVCSLDKCGKQLKSGDKVVSFHKGGKKRAIHFHQRCWAEKFI